MDGDKIERRPTGSGGTKPILVTGAGSGIGRAITESLAGTGKLVYATVRTRRDSESLQALTNVHPIMMDVTRIDDVRRGVAHIRRAGKGLYGVVNNAGIVDVWPMVELEDKELRRSFEVNVLGAHRVVRETIPLLVQARGRIVNISSLEGLVSTKFVGPYEMSKFALEAYSDNLRRELREHGVKVVIVEPGGFRTNYAKTTAKVLARRMRVLHPKIMKREVDEIAKAWRDEIRDVEKRASPSILADTVREALFTEEPKHRYLVTAKPAEFHWTMDELMSKLIEVNRGYHQSLSKDDLKGLLDQMWAKSSENQ